jgi:hypothetical protein
MQRDMHHTVLAMGWVLHKHHHVLLTDEESLTKPSTRPQKTACISMSSAPLGTTISDSQLLSGFMAGKVVKKAFDHWLMLV